ncbi:signal recognition particle protein [Rickettsiales endosymbiont of Stachyamoeba lipophora]|uniref:signal recognition particle protein n=1 Tax=Rickettsiales endosymbiont of Stachyamoeba lipophora TaxID=2486578 RepID=UPI000F64DCC1|nr:signal recognition particle protein [Rickettsiales endosymbiont of Stachyamoeba lipophora]AZL15654.1 signal recognition particle protein [Rickettsiales endosymbiont of Stachyamoeba lipophora]
MFSSLQHNLAKIFDKLKGKGLITEEDVNTAAREIRIALLEADVALPVIKQLIDKLKHRAVGENVIQSISAVQQIIKIINDIIVETLASDEKELKLNTAPPAVIMMAGLQGAGKTTSSAKLAKYIQTKLNKRVLLVSTDIYRPAAQEQLATLALKNSLTALEIIKEQKPLDIVKRGLEAAKKENFDVIIIDTAGRLHTDATLMNELQQITDLAKPVETLLVLDSMTGQDAINIAHEFKNYLAMSGVIFTRIDGDARGGAALSITQSCQLPIKFLSTGEKIDDIEIFDATRIASRILGMGDVVSLVEKASSVISEQEAEKMTARIMQGKFDMNDLANQIKNIKKMGGMFSLMNLMPGMNKLKQQMHNANVDEKIFEYQLAIIHSMTKKERKNPTILNGSRRKRIANGSGRSIEEVNKLMKMHKDMGDAIKKFTKMDKKSFSRSGLGKLFS